MITTNKHLVEQYLKDEPRFRERSNRERGIVNLLLNKYPILKDVPKDTLVELCHDFSNMDRCWRKILEEQPTLRGKDYDDKPELEKNAREELGYIS
jgi:hypothetical protein